MQFLQLHSQITYVQTLVHESFKMVHKVFYISNKQACLVRRSFQLMSTKSSITINKSRDQAQFYMSEIYFDN